MLPVVIDLPTSICQGTGAVLSAYAYMEWRIFIVLITLLDIDDAEGRVVFAYSSPKERLKTIRTLFARVGVRPPISIKRLIVEVDNCTLIRNQLAHGIWAVRGGDIVLQTTRDVTEVEGEIQRHDFLPNAIDVSGTYFQERRAEVLRVVGKIEEILAAAKRVQSARRAEMIARWKKTDQ